jgi:hypothetical protein
MATRSLELGDRLFYRQPELRAGSREPVKKGTGSPTLK